MTERPFYTWPFPVGTGLTSRTTPDRLKDVTNVKDWGALGNGSSDDRAAIQAAIDYITTPPRTGGQIFFPPGSYKVAAPLIVGSAYDVEVELIGCGKESTSLTKTLSGYSAGGNDYVISSGSSTYDNLARIHGIGRINVKLTRDHAVIENCICVAGDDLIACNAVGANNVAIRGCQGEEGPPGTQPANSATPHAPPGSIVWAMGSGVISGCRAVGGYDVGIAMGGAGCVATGNSVEVCNTAVRIGWGPDGAGGVAESPATGCVVQGLQTEKCTVGIDLYNATGCYIAGNFTSGTVGPPTPATISSATWSGGTVTATSTAHSLGSHSAPRRIQILGFTNSAWNPPNYNSHPGGNRALVEASVVDANNFSFSHPVDPTGSGASGTCQWTWPGTYEMRCRKVYHCVIASHSFQTIVSEASLDLDYNGAADHLNNVFIGAQTPLGVKIPSAGKNWAAWTFIRANGYNNYWNDATAKATPYLSMVYADLPGESGVSEPRVEGQEFYVLAQKSGGGGATAATWGDTVATGTAGRYLVRFDGTNWKRIG